jgi:hypothetical protein
VAKLGEGLSEGERVGLLLSSWLRCDTRVDLRVTDIKL